jgi:predicted NBD/HSP70 family sugar kinase
LVDNDVNLMALGESRAIPATQLPLLMIKVGTGIGGGLVAAGGELIRGADGAAGDIGHVSPSRTEDVVCTCGNRGCLEAVASLQAMAAKLTSYGLEPATQDHLIKLLRAGDGTATRLLRDAAAYVGDVVASLVHIFNPARICLAGRLTAASDDLLAGVRSAVYWRALPLATRNLTITYSTLGAYAGLVGALVLGTRFVLSAAQISHLRQRRVQTSI